MRMKTILVTVVLAVAGAAAAQTPQGQPAQPAQTQPGQTAAAPSSQAPVIKDPNEYNAYVGAIQQKDPTAQISGLEAFLAQYPNSIMKTAALQTLMQDYQQTNNQAKTVETAQKLLAADPTNERALFLLAYIDRMKAQADQNPKTAQDEIADAKKYGQMGLDNLSKFTKPEGTSDADFQKMKDQMTAVFNAAIGLADLIAKDYPEAQKDLRAAVDGSPDFQKEFSLVYPLALSYLQATPQDSIDGIWYGARAIAIAPAPQVGTQITPYIKGQYIKYHGGDDGWTDVLAQAKANPLPPAGFTIKPAPTPAEQAHNMLQATPPDQMDFATWQFIFTNGSQADQDTLWNAIKGKPAALVGTVIKATPTEFDIAGSSDDIDAKKADITLTFEEKVPLKLVPKEGASLEFEGEPASYTPNPFMMTMNNGKLVKTAAPAPAKKPAAHHATASQ
jgi:hypothetical protein